MVTSTLLPVAYDDDESGTKHAKGSVVRQRKVLYKKTRSGLKSLTEKKWGQFIGLVATGITVNEARKMAGIALAVLEGVVRVKEECHQQLEDAKLTALRLHWDMETIEDILVALAVNTDATTMKEIVEDHGCSYEGFMKLALHDPTVSKMYEDARILQMEGMADEIIMISDQSGSDIITTQSGHTKVNHEVIQRDALRVKTRQWIMSKLHHKRFGDKLSTEMEVKLTVDHIATLESARKRREALHKMRASGVTVEQLNDE